MGDLLDAPWPAVDESALVQDEIELMLQINGKLRGALRVPASAEQAQIERAALASPEFAKFARRRAGEEGRSSCRAGSSTSSSDAARRVRRSRRRAGTLAGCGFELQAARRSSASRRSSSPVFRRARRSPPSCKSSIDASTTTHVVEAAKDAQVVLQALAEAREKAVVAHNRRRPDPRIRAAPALQLSAAHGRRQGADPGQRDLAAALDITYTETAALAKEQEEAFLYRAMQSDIVSQVLRRLASVRLL